MEIKELINLLSCISAPIKHMCVTVGVNKWVNKPVNKPAGVHLA